MLHERVIVREKKKKFEVSCLRENKSYITLHYTQDNILN